MAKKKIKKTSNAQRSTSNRRKSKRRAARRKTAAPKVRTFPKGFARISVKGKNQRIRKQQPKSGAPIHIGSSTSRSRSTSKRKKR